MTTSSKTNMNEDLRKEVRQKIDKALNRYAIYMIGHADSASNRGYNTYGNLGLELEQIFETAVSKAKADGVKEAYTIFLKEIKSAKNKFPNKKEFEIVVDARDIEKSLKLLTQKK